MKTAFYRLENGWTKQENVDHFYDQFCDLMYTEINEYCVGGKKCAKESLQSKTTILE